jgi:hypothetical protein
MLRLALIVLVALTSVANAATLYQLTNNSLATNAQPVIREADGATIPNAAGNADWQAYLVWLAVPNVPDAAPAPVSVTYTLQITSTSYGSALNGTYRIDQISQSQIVAISTYILYAGKFPPTAADPTGATLAWLDSSKTYHTFPSVAEFQAFAAAVAIYLTNYQISGVAGSQPVTIP